jgi:hypothetical protein
MKLTIKSLSVISEGHYRAVFENKDGPDVDVAFIIKDSEGISPIECEPDIFMQGHAYAKDIMAIIKAFHTARSRSHE